MLRGEFTDDVVRHAAFVGRGRGNVIFLDCQTADTALISLAGACGKPAQVLAQAISYHRIDWDADFGREDPEIVGLRMILDPIGLTIADFRFDGAYYFHGTRVLDHSGFRTEGILPLDQMIDRIWDSLYALIADMTSEDEWRRHRTAVETGAVDNNGVYQYQLKTTNALHFGPYSLLTRDAHINPPDGHHNYLNIPEIVEDIAQNWHPELAHRFATSAKPCIVKFLQRNPVETPYVRSAMWYLYGALNADYTGWYSHAGYDCGGIAVAPADITQVEVIDDI